MHALRSGDDRLFYGSALLCKSGFVQSLLYYRTATRRVKAPACARRPSQPIGIPPWHLYMPADALILHGSTLSAPTITCVTAHGPFCRSTVSMYIQWRI